MLACILVSSPTSRAVPCYNHKGMHKGLWRKLLEKIRSAVSGIWFVVRQPGWTAVALIAAYLISLIIYFSINFGYYGAVLGGGNLSLLDRFEVIGLMSLGMVGSYFADFGGVLLLVVSLLQGVSLAVLIYTARQNRKLDALVAGRSGLALLLATIGLGCVPCGTSLLIPLMTILFSSSAPALIGTANQLVLVAAILLTVYALYLVGQVAFKHYQMEELKR